MTLSAQDEAHENRKEANERGIRSRPDILSIAFLILIIVIFCHATIFEGRPVSKIGLINQEELLLNPGKKGTPFSCQFDPSLYQLKAPNDFSISRLWHSGEIPLWNPDNGCGYSLIGDPQSHILSPFRLLFPQDNFYLYNLGIVAELIFGAITMYCLARSLGLSSIPSIFAATAYSLCPYYLWYFELPNHFGLYPLVVLTLVKLWQDPTIKKGMAAGLVYAILVYTMHSEASFFSIIMASLLYFLLAWKVKDRSTEKSMAVYVKPFVVAATIAFCFTSPMIFSFVESLLNTTCYKSQGLGMGSNPMDWFVIISNLLVPANGKESPFLGIMVAILFPFALIKRNPRIDCLLILLAISFFISSNCNILSASVFSYLVPVYCFPVFLLTVSILAGFGLQIVSKEVSENKPIFKYLLALSLAVVLIPLFVSLCSGGILSNLSTPPLSTKFDIGSATRMVSFLPAAVFVVLVYFLSTMKTVSQKQIAAMGIVIIFLNLGSQILPAQSAFPARENFSFTSTPINDQLKKLEGRFVGLGIHTYLPNTNQIFGTSDFRLYNPFFPNRYLEYITAAGAKKHDLYLYCFHNPDSKLLNLASVKYIISPDSLPKSDERFKLLFEDKDKVRLYENQDALPNAYFVYDYKMVDNGNEALKEICRDSFDPRKVVVLESPELKSSKSEYVIADSNDEMVKVELSRPRKNKVALSVNAKRGGYLVLTDTFYPGWEATVDNTRVEILRANYLFKAIPVAQGNHHVVFEYKPKPFLWGLCLAALAIIASIAYLALTLLSSNKK